MSQAARSYEFDGRKRVEDITTDHYVNQGTVFIQVKKIFNSEEDGYGILLDNDWDRTPDDDGTIPVYIKNN